MDDEIYDELYERPPLTKKEAEGFWLDVSDAADLCKMSVRNFHERIRPHLRPPYARGQGAKLRLWAHAVVAVYLNYKLGPCESCGRYYDVGRQPPGTGERKKSLPPPRPKRKKAQAGLQPRP